MIRGFKVVSDEHRVHGGTPIKLPQRATKYSSCYDFYSPEDIVVPAHGMVKIKTDVCAYMMPDEVLKVYPRSSMGKVPVMLANTVGIIDSDYYCNPDNGGNIIVMLNNLSDNDYVIGIGDRFAQGMFQKYLIADDDSANNVRTGGIGSTGT